MGGSSCLVNELCLGSDKFLEEVHFTYCGTHRVINSDGVNTFVIVNLSPCWQNIAFDII